ncbi:BCD1-like protein [Mya arenaria]|uniref:BCD1-like protein n=1 Tax=Mya arenaria TaxID=6604 RepID=A0ABY7GBA4_MYAAR|nr:BCD1-like protein [Mya arenaria]
MDEVIARFDYRFLEDGGRKTNNAARDQLKRSSVPNFLRTIETQAKHRGVRLRLMPYPMTKRKTNSTYYQYKSKTLHWHVEWEFPEINYTTTDRSLDLDQTLSENLKDKEIVEYPTLVVVQRKNWDDYSLAAIAL